MSTKSTKTSESTMRRKCDECDCPDSVHKIMRTEQFVYGVEPNDVTLQVTIPVYECSVCRDAYTDYEAELIRQEAIDEYLGENK